MNNLILLTGATGYVGGRLLKELEHRGYRIRCMARRPEYLENRVSHTTQVVQGDIFNDESLRRSLQGIHTAYYLVHSLGAGGSFEENDRRAAQGFAKAAHDAQVKKIIYLGGLGKGSGLSAHLASRQEVGALLRNSGIPTVEFRASIIIGSGSLSFEMVRSLVQKLPLMTTPRWVRSLAQPIAIEDVISYLTAALEKDFSESVIFEIGGADTVSYEDIMREYTRIRGLKRVIMPVPLLTPQLSSLWLTLVTPLYFRVGRRLMEGVRNATTVTDNRALQEFAVRPRGIHEAIRRALENEDREYALTRWSDSLQGRNLERRWGGIRFGSRLVCSFHTRSNRASPDVFKCIQCIGGTHGWYRSDWVWNLRGMFDQLIGGVGSRRGRRDPYCLLPGDTVDFWRVETLEPGRLLRLQAELKIPGRMWLQFEVNSGGASGIRQNGKGEESMIRQTVLFDPVGLGGLLYWYIFWPAHILIFRAMFKGLLASAQSTNS